MVQALPGPTPTSTPTAPVRMRWSPAWYEAQPPTMTGMSNSRMKRFRLSGSTVLDTCSAETTVPWMTSRSSSAARMAGASSTVRWGVTEAAVVMPASFIWRMRSVTSSSLIGSAYICCIRGGGLLVVELADLVEQRRRVLVAGPQALEVEDPRPPSRPSSMAVWGLITPSMAAPRSGRSNR